MPSPAHPITDPQHDSLWLRLVDAVISGDEETVQSLLEDATMSQKFLNAAQEEDGTTALHVAAQAGHLGIVQLFLKKGATSSIYATTDDNETPLAFAAEAGHYEVSKLLVDHGADVNNTSTYGSVFTDAVTSGHIDLVRMLVDLGVDINFVHPEQNKRTPLMMAAEEGFLDIVELLLDRGATTVLHHRSEYDGTALSCACHRGHLEVAQLLVSRGAAVDNDVFVFAVSSGCVDATRFVVVQMLESLSTPNAIVRLTEETCALKRAADYGFHNVAHFLLRIGADANIRNGDVTETPLQVAAAYNFTDLLHLLVHHGAEVNMADVFGGCALRCAANNGNTDVTSFLLGVSAGVGLTL